MQTYQGHLFIAVNFAEFRGTKVKNVNFVVISRRKSTILRPFRGRNFEFRGHFAAKFIEFRDTDNFAVEFTNFM